MGRTTKKQHYVWRKYLVPWTDNSDLKTGKVYVCRKVIRGTQQRIEQQELMKIGFENYYYDISGFNDKDISVHRQFIEHYQKTHRIKWDVNLDSIGIAHLQKDFIEKEIMCPIEDIDNKYGFLDKLNSCDVSFYKDSDRQKVINTLKKAMFEGILYQEQILCDDDLVKLMEKFVQDIDNPDLKYEFNHFLSMQYFRSPRIHKNLFESFNEFKKLSETFSDLNTKTHVNLITLFFAQKMALSLTENPNTSITLFNNKSSTPFITGDTPVVNISDREDIAIFHYPVSPAIAINLVASQAPQKNVFAEIDETTKALIDSQNRKLYQNCVNEVYSNEQGAFEAYSAT